MPSVVRWELNRKREKGVCGAPMPTMISHRQRDINRESGLPVKLEYRKGHRQYRTSQKTEIRVPTDTIIRFGIRLGSIRMQLANSGSEPPPFRRLWRDKGLRPSLLLLIVEDRVDWRTTAGHHRQEGAPSVISKDRTLGGIMPNENHGDQPFGPHLVCRAFQGDTGGRPLDPNTIFYESPDIWVVAPDGTDVPAVGVVNQAQVRVWNFGSAASYGTTVELFWCDPSIGVHLAAATPIGVQTTTIQPGSHKILTFPWIPVFVNNGHECLVAQVYDPVSDNLAAPFNPVADRHVAQKNLNLIPLAAGRQIDVHFFAANPTKRTQISQIEVEPIVGDALRRLADARGLGHVREVDGAESTIASIESQPVRSRLKLTEHPVAAVFRDSLAPTPSAYSRQLQQIAMSAIPPEPLRQPTQVATQTPKRNPNHSVARMIGERRVLEIPAHTELRLTLTLRLPNSARPGSLAAFRIVERTEDRITGGVTYILRTIASIPTT